MTAGVAPPLADTASLARARFARTIAVSDAFFGAHSVQLAHACRSMARCFEQGGRLLVHAEPGRRSDASHAVVEFMHPVVVGKRALPAVAVRSAAELATLGRAQDVLLTMADAGVGPEQRALVDQAARMAMLSIALAGPGTLPPAQFAFVVPSDDAFIVQEAHEMAYHVLWELVHVFLDHKPAP